MSDHAAPALELRGLTLESRTQKLVDDLTLTVGAREVVGLVGESGSGKSQSALSIAGLGPAGVVRTAGTVAIGGREADPDDKAGIRALRGREVAYIFQEPMTALNPAIRIRTQMRDIISRSRAVPRRKAEREAADALSAVHMADRQRVLRAYPHELSGGMRQRILIALAFACRPRLIVADEPTTALDVLVQAQILALMAELSRDRECGVLFISHDLAVVRQICHRVYVMRGGRIVEHGPVEEILSRPRNDYTRQLLASSAEEPAP